MNGGSLFGVHVPDGFSHRENFIRGDEEARLAEEIAGIAFAEFEMRGVVARRRVALVGQSYESGGPVTPIPAFLAPLRSALADWAGLKAEAFAMALINEYPPGAPIGWHRDAPQYDIVAGLSLLSPCRMKFRPYVRSNAGTPSRVRRTATHEVTLEPRSAYLMRGPARSDYEHHIPAVAALRYSITFRSMRA